MNNKIISLIGAVSMLAVTGAASAATVSLNPDVVNVSLGDSFTLAVEGTAFDNGASSGGVRIVWDPTTVSLTTTAVDISSALGGLGFIPLTLTVDAVAGIVETDFGSFLGSVGPDFTLFTLDFLAIPPPSTSNIDIGISTFAGAWQDGQAIAQPIAVTFQGATVNVSAVPVPPAVWLFGSGLLGLVGVARRRELLAA